MKTLTATCVLLSFSSAAVAGERTDAAAAVTELPVIQITATKEPEPLEVVPASVTVVTGEELRARGANDLRTALALVAGVEGTPAGDGGPAGSVPALWGLREADAFLLVVDGVPLGGVFNPITSQVDLTGVERIEVVRGATPVTYGATSFNGVIHIIHYAPDAVPETLTVGGGSNGSYGASGSVKLPTVGRYQQSLTANVEKRGFSVARQEFQRYHFLYRGGVRTDTGGFHADVDVSVLPQVPGNAVFRNGANLRTDLIPADSNANPSDARLNQTHLQANLGLDFETALGQWNTTLSLAQTHDDIVRGFLRDYAPATGNTANGCAGGAPDPAGPDGKCDVNDADGFSQKRLITDLYFDTHLLFPIDGTASAVIGIDVLTGQAKQSANNFGYFIALDGSNAPASTESPVDEVASLTNTRFFSGLYGQVDWAALPNVDVLAGVRMNVTHERVHGEAIDIAGGHAGDQSGEGHLTRYRPSGMVGLSWHVLQTETNHLTLYGDYRNTFKPLATDLGPEAEFDVLRPETSNSYEVGVKGETFGGRLRYDVSAFRLDFNNLKTQDDTGATVNAGKTRFTGVETESRLELVKDFQVAANYAYHDSRFLAFNRNGTPGGNVAGNRLELAPYHLAGLGLLYTPPQGLNVTVTGNYTGERKLNKSNSLSKGGFVTVDASVGYRFNGFAVNVNAYNLSDRREPIAESELSEAVSGASSYYLMPARSVFASFTVPLN